MTEKLNATLLRTTIVAALGGALLGFDTAVISGTTHALSSIFRLSSVELGITVSAALWGTVAGAIGAGGMGRRLGPSTSLLVFAGCYLVSALGSAFSTNWSMFLAARFVGGLGMGGSSVIAPVYIAEVAPSPWRGRLVGAFQINIIVGILLAYLSNAVIGLFSLGALEWRWQLGVATIPALMFLVLMFGNPPSPRWLALQGRLQEAGDALKRLGVPETGAELDRIVKSLRESFGAGHERLFQRTYRKPIFLAVALAVFNQTIGINAVLYYLNDIFAAAGYDRASQNFQAVAVGVIMLVATLLAISLIDRFGRRTLLLAGSVGLAICLAAISAIFYTREYTHTLLIFVIGYVGFFAFSQGSVIWVYLSEIFPARVRSQGQSLGCSTHWIMDALISAIFPVLASASPSGPFLFFLGMVTLQFFTVLLFFPETRGIALEDMHNRLKLVSVSRSGRS